MPAAATTAAAVEITDLVMSYAGRRVVDGLTLIAPAGQVTIVLGPNGAGKSTTIETAEGFRRAHQGVVRVLGRDPRAQAAELRARVGVMLQSGGVWPATTARTLLTHLARLYAHPQPVSELLELVDLTSVAGTAYRRLSGGEQRRVQLAAALVGRPELVFLDEPTTGLDPAARVATWQLITALREAGVSVVMTTHLLDEAEALADQLVIIGAGRVIAAGSPSTLRADLAKPTLRFSAPIGLDLTTLRLGPGLRASTEGAGKYQVTGPITPRTAAAVTAWCADQGVMPGELTTTASLQELYFQLTAVPR